MRLSSVGDIVLTEPVVAALRATYPNAEIGFVVKSDFADLVRANPHLDHVHLLTRGPHGGLRELGRELRAARYSAFLDLHGNIRSFLLSRASGASVVLSYRKRELKDTLRVRLGRRAFRARRKLVERYLESLAPLGIRAGYARPRFHLAERDLTWARALLSERGLERRAFAAMVPGSNWATKRWPPDRFTATAAAIRDQLGLSVVLLGSPSERELCESIARVVGQGAHVAAGATSLGQMAAVLSLARVYIGNDSGPTHMAMALDTPTVAIFGPTDPGQFDFEGHALAFADAPCSACSFFGTEACRLGHWECMKLISVEEVVRLVKELCERGGEK